MNKQYFRILILLMAATLLSQGIRAQNVENSRKLVRVLTFNILHGATMNGDFNLDLIANEINEAKPDFVALQEVDFKTGRAKNYDLATELGWRTKMIPLFARAIFFDGGEYGNAILSNHTIIKSRTVPLPCSPKGEPRVAVEITVVLPSKDTIAFVATHLEATKDQTDRVNQVKKINEEFSTNKYPTILAGDFNATPESLPVSILEQVWTGSSNRNNSEPTFPSANPTRKIDYVMFLPKDRWKVMETRVIQNSVASDHCAYLVTMELQ